MQPRSGVPRNLRWRLRLFSRSRLLLVSLSDAEPVPVVYRSTGRLAENPWIRGFVPIFSEKAGRGQNRAGRCTTGRPTSRGSRAASRRAAADRGVRLGGVATRSRGYWVFVRMPKVAAGARSGTTGGGNGRAAAWLGATWRGGRPALRAPTLRRGANSWPCSRPGPQSEGDRTPLPPRRVLVPAVAGRCDDGARDRRCRAAPGPICRAPSTGPARLPGCATWVPSSGWSRTSPAIRRGERDNRAGQLSPAAGSCPTC